MADLGDALAKLVPPQLRELLRSRALLIKRPVWGRRHGRHRSARGGVGLEFRDHRPYVPGDDPRNLDWRAVARNDRLMLRQTEAEDDLAIVMVVDHGGGMAYGDGFENKARLAHALVGGLAWLAARQGDPIGLLLGQDGHADGSLTRPAGGRDRVMAIARALAQGEVAGSTDWPPLLDGLVPRLPRRSLVLVFSDFLDPDPKREPSDDGLSELTDRLANLRARGHDVVLVQILHRDELTFPWTGPAMTRFVDARSARPDVEGPAAGLRKGYLDRLRAHMERLSDICESSGLVLLRVVSDQPATEAFVSLLGWLEGSHPGSADAEVAT